MDSDGISNAGTEVAINETTALLADSVKPGPPPSTQADEHALPRNGSRDEDDEKPLPKDQIFFLCLARLVEPVAFFCIFPFINQMIVDTGTVAETDVGFYSGLIESLFSLTQMLLMIPWGWASDRVGRKPVLVFSLGGVAIGTTVFGLSKTVRQMIAIRCFTGFFAGSVVTVRVMISENSTPKTQARAFSFFAFAANLGLFLGPLLGGALADPTRQYPRLFRHIKLFRVFPFALSTFVTGGFVLAATLVCAVFLKETLVKTTSSPGSPAKPRMSTSQLLQAPNVAIALYIYVHVTILAYAFTAILPVFYFTPIPLGGFGFSPIQISFFFAISGLSQSLWLLIVFPWLQRRIGTAGVMKACGIAYPFCFALFPLFNIALRSGWTTLFWMGSPVFLVLCSGVSMVFITTQLVVNDSSPKPEVLGTLNAVALTLSSGMRAVCPGLFASLFATSVRSGIWGGHLIWALMTLLGVAFTIISRWTPEGPTKKTNSAHEGQN